MGEVVAEGEGAVVDCFKVNVQVHAAAALFAEEDAGFGLAWLLVYKAKTVGLCQRKMLSASSSIFR